MRSLLVTLLSLGASSLFGQGIPDLSGEWNGTSNFLKTNYKVTTVLTQKGNQLEGYTTTWSIKGDDSTKVKVTGLIDDDEVKLYPVEFIYKVGMACLSNSVFTFSDAGDQYALEGKWKGDLSLKTCAPGVGGGIKMYKRKPVRVNYQSSPLTSFRPIDKKDEVGNVLVNELGKRKYYALIIGIDKYPDEEIQELDNPVNDGVQLAQVLAEEYSFDRTDMILLKNPGRAEIIEALDELTTKVTERDNLLIFYAGHGIWNEQLNQGYWLPSDAKMNSKSNWLSNSTIRDYVGGIRSKHTLLVSDACFSGGILKERAVFENSRAMLELYKLPSRKAMTSGTLKTVPDESVFIEYLIKNLKSNQSPLLSADHLFRNFKLAVINNSPNGQVPQYGPITQAGDEGGDFIFLRKQQ